MIYQHRNSLQTLQVPSKEGRRREAACATGENLIVRMDGGITPAVARGRGTARGHMEVSKSELARRGPFQEIYLNEASEARQAVGKTSRGALCAGWG